MDASVIDPAVIFGALTGAITWNLVTWGLGIPSSSSHALVGGIVGAGTAKAGFGAIVWSGLGKTLFAIVLSPTIGMLLALFLVLIVSWIFARTTPFKVDSTFRSLQFVSASLYSLGHGGNDAQKTMGIIAVLLYSQGLLEGGFHVPFWVVITCQAAMGLGTLLRRLAHRPHHGIEDHPPHADAGLLRRDRAAPSPCSRRPASAFRSRPRTPSPAPSSASAPRAAPRRCAGASRATSWSPG